MSMDFDAAALQTQHEEEDDDEEDYERQQELHKLLTDLPDDMLEDSRECSSPEPEEYPAHSRPQPAWTQQMQWSDHPEENYKDVSDPRGHQAQPWVQQAADSQYSQQGEYSYASVGTEEANDLGTELGYPHGTHNGQEGDQRDRRNHDHGAEGPGAEQKRTDHYHVNYNPQQTRMFSSRTPPLPPGGPGLDHLQRQFLHSTHNGADGQQLAQLQVLHKAQQRQTEELEKKLEDSQRNMRCLQHQFAIVKDEKDGLAVSLKESSRMAEEARARELQLNNTVHSLEEQIHTLTEREHQYLQKLQAAEASMDSMKLQITDLCRSETLSRAREQHDLHLTSMKEQHDATVLALSQRIDATSQALKEQTEVSQRLKEHVHQLELQREEERVERSKVINTLNQRLEESQRQCAALLQSGSVQEMNQMQAKLHQAQKDKTLSENMSLSLQEDLSELKEQITLYESAVKMGVMSLELNGGDWEKQQLSESYVDLGIKRSNWKNNTIHSAALADLSEDSVKELRAELQRCLLCLKGKRQKISQLQDRLGQSEARASLLQSTLDETAMKESIIQPQHLDVSVASKKELMRLQQDKQHLQEQLEELKQSEENLKSVNAELCSKMRQMIQELDQEKQEDAERSERTQQQYRNDVVNRVRTQLLSEHKGHVDQMTSAHQQHLHTLQTELSEASDRLAATQEDYVSVCKEKDQLEMKLTNEKILAVQKLRSELEAEHQTNIQAQLASARTVWEEEHMKVERTSVHTETQTETTETQEEASQAVGGGVSSREEASQTVGGGVSSREEASQTVGGGVSPEDLASTLCVQKRQLLLEAEKKQFRAVEDARMETRRELQQKYLEDMTTQVEGALTRAYSRWLEDLTSLPEYKEHLQREKERWTEQHQRHLQQQVSEARSEAEEECQRRLRVPVEEKKREEEQRAGSQRAVEELQHHMDRLRAEQEVLTKAQLAEARASWNRDRQQEVSSLRAKLQEEQQEALRLREEQWRRQQQDTEQRSRERFLLELQTELAELQKEKEEEERRSEPSRRSSISSIIQAAYRELLQKAVVQAKRQWRTVSEDRLSRVLKETQEQHESEIRRIQSSVSQREEAVCGQRCAESTGKLQQKIQDLQRHLEKACRQLQLSVRQKETVIQRLKDDHEQSLQKLKENHLLHLDEVKNNNELSQKQNLERGLEEMKVQYHNAVEKIRGDMLQYLQDSKQKAAQMIRMEVQKERQVTARKMRHYYLSCLQELLEDGGQSTGAEKKIMNAASKLASMARVLETPVKRKPEKNHSLQVIKVSESPSASDHQSSKTHQDTMTPSGKDPAPCRPSPAPCRPSPAPHVTASVGRRSRDESKDGKGLMMQEAPVRDLRGQSEQRSSRVLPNTTSSHHQGSFQHPTLLLPSSSSVSDRRAFSSLSGSLDDLAAFDSSDFTVYNQIIANVPPSHRDLHHT